MTYRTYPKGKWLTDKMYELWSVGDNYQSCSYPCKAEGVACTHVMLCKEPWSIRNTGKTIVAAVLRMRGSIVWGIAEDTRLGIDNKEAVQK